MKTLTPEQRIEGFTELEGVVGEGGVGGAHLMSFLAGIAHAEKVLAEPKQDEEPFGFYFEPTDVKDNYFYPFFQRNKNVLFNQLIPFKISSLYLHPAPRPEFVRLSEEEIVSWWGVATEAGLIEFARAIEDALEEKNK